MNRRTVIALALAGLVIVLAVALVAAFERGAPQGEQVASIDETQTFPTTPTPLPAPAATAAARSVAAAIPANASRPAPKEEIFRGCPAEGDGTYPELNRLKNRIDEPAAPTPLAFAALETLGWPAGVNKKHMPSWSAGDRAQVEQYNGLGVAMEAYLIRVQDEGPESNNCHQTAPDQVDYHLWIVGRQGDDRDKAVVIEMNPRLRATHPAWTLQNLRQLGRQGAHVRITGWIMLDPEHPDQVGKTRGTIWELHPVTRVEVDQGGGRWQALDK